MDKVTDWAYLLFVETSDDEVKEIAKRLLNGDLSVKDLKSMDKIKVHFKSAKKKRRKGYINNKELNRFVEEYLSLED
ncbi:hypothetical protein [Neobacillus cucumis]|uniref:hypothetical protein n=1 Tax=Neobacillus cucumis TaxID=1740721 RepID=UPI001963954F|nr:hypothetical protein [Neobacillus cucumis]MBM7656226.1 ribosome recycling factor [Neobacillus cucumis]